MPGLFLGSTPITPSLPGLSAVHLGSTLLWPVGGFNPADLFLPGDIGGFYDANVLSSLWQNEAGTTPVTASGQTVQRWDDLSGNGRHLIKSRAQSSSKNSVRYEATGTMGPRLDRINTGSGANQCFGANADFTSPTTHTYAYIGLHQTSGGVSDYDVLSTRSTISSVSGAISLKPRPGNPQLRINYFNVYSANVNVTGPSAGISNGVPVRVYADYDTNRTNSAKITVNNVAYAEYNPKMNKTNNMRLGLGLGKDTSEACMLFFIDRVLTAGEKTDLLAWMEDRQALTAPS